LRREEDWMDAGKGFNVDETGGWTMARKGTCLDRWGLYRGLDRGVDRA